jgi:hypothetical protein
VSEAPSVPHTARRSPFGPRSWNRPPLEARTHTARAAHCSVGAVVWVVRVLGASRWAGWWDECISRESDTPVCLVQFSIRHPMLQINRVDTVPNLNSAHTVSSRTSILTQIDALQVEYFAARRQGVQ